MKLQLGLLSDDLSRWKRAFIEEKKALGRAKSTIEQYSRVIDSFIEYSLEREEELDISSINHELISFFLLWKEKEVKSEKIELSSRNLYITVLKNFYLYITQHNDELIDFTKNLDRLKLKKERKEKRFYITEEISRINLYLDKELDNKLSFSKARNILILKLFILGGLRVMEIQALRLSDIEIEEDRDNESNSVCKILINGKGNKQRVIYISYEKLYYSIKAYKKELEKAKEINIDIDISKEYIEDRVAISSKLKPMHRSQIDSGIKNLLKKASPKVLNLHALRRSFANMVNRLENSTLKDVQELLGHEDINTTSIYLNSGDSDKKEIARRVL